MGSAPVNLILFGIFAALANVFGGLLLFPTRSKPGYKRSLKYLLAVGAGFMLAVTFFEIVPKTIFLWQRTHADSSDELYVPMLLLLVGYLLTQFVEHTIAPHFHLGEEVESDAVIPVTSAYSGIAGFLVRSFFRRRFDRRRFADRPTDRPAGVYCGAASQVSRRLYHRLDGRGGGKGLSRSNDRHGANRGHHDARSCGLCGCRAKFSPGGCLRAAVGQRRDALRRGKRPVTRGQSSRREAPARLAFALRRCRPVFRDPLVRSRAHVTLSQGQEISDFDVGSALSVCPVVSVSLRFINLFRDKSLDNPCSKTIRRQQLE